MAEQRRVDEDGLKVTSILAEKHDHAIVDSTADLDEKVLEALGYR